MRFTRILATVLLAFCLTATLCAQNRSTKQIKVVRVTNLSRQTGTATFEVGGETRNGPDVDVTFTKPQITGSLATARVPSAHVPTPVGSAVITPANDVFSGFNAISHFDQRFADLGNQFSIEPPDQGMAVGNGFVVESVNLAVRVFDTHGVPQTPTVSLNRFLGLASAISRNANPVTVGPFVSDPRILYDQPTGRFFLTVLVIATDPLTGAFLGNSSVYIAVSNSSDPTGNWTILTLDTTNDCGAFAPAPCFGDQPLIGADANAFFITTNAFSLVTNGFAGANLYAIPKTSLLAPGGAVSALHIGGLTEAGAPFAFSIQPAAVPPGGAYAPNTEYFVSALDFTNTVDNRLVVWALKGTNNLSTATLVNSVVNTQSYGAPPNAQQKPGPFPLGESIKQKEELVASNDDRLQQVVFADGKLWTALSTSAKTQNGPVRTATAWFILQPSVSATGVSASVVNQGYIAIDSPNQQNVLFPSVAVNNNGKGVVAFSVVGADFYPSAGYAPIDVGGTGAIRISGAGASPEDGFTGYDGGRTSRWGDYSAASADEFGNVWMANEYIPNAIRSVNANWGTFLGGFTPQ